MTATTYMEILIKLTSYTAFDELAIKKQNNTASKCKEQWSIKTKSSKFVKNDTDM